MEIRIKKERLATIIHENMEKHEREFAEALTGYYTTIASYYTALADAARRQRDYDQPLEYHRRPASYVSEYKSALRMLALGENPDEEISLSEEDFSRYVEDNWTWRNEFQSTVAKYSNK